MMMRLSPRWALMPTHNPHSWTLAAVLTFVLNTKACWQLFAAHEVRMVTKRPQPCLSFICALVSGAHHRASPVYSPHPVLHRGGHVKRRNMKRQKREPGSCATEDVYMLVYTRVRSDTHLPSEPVDDVRRSSCPPLKRHNLHQAMSFAAQYTALRTTITVSTRHWLSVIVVHSRSFYVPRHTGLQFYVPVASLYHPTLCNCFLARWHESGFKQVKRSLPATHTCANMVRVAAVSGLICA